MCLSFPGMKYDWTDGTKGCWSRLFVYAIVLLGLPSCSYTSQVRLKILNYRTLDLIKVHTRAPDAIRHRDANF